MESPTLSATFITLLAVECVILTGTLAGDFFVRFVPVLIVSSLPLASGFELLWC
jgi:hypothetical protein